MTRQDLIDIGFEDLPHKTVHNALNYQLPRDRYLTLGCFATPNEMLCLAMKSSDSLIPSDLIVLHNYDYDGGYITMDRIKSIIYGITGEHVKEKEKEKIMCYEIHRPNIPQYGCEKQCKECSVKEEKIKSESKTKLSLEIIEKYGFKKKTFRPDNDDVQNDYTLPNGLVLGTLTVCFNEPCESDSLEGLDGYIYIETKEELDVLLSKTYEEIINEIAYKNKDFDIDEYL